MLSRFSDVRLCATPWTVALQAPLSVGFSRQEYWSGFAISSSRGSFWPRDRICICCLGRWIISAEPPGEPTKEGIWMLNKHMKRCSISSLHFSSSVAQSCPTLCDRMNRSMPVQYFRERQIKTTVRSHYASSRTVKIFKTEYNNQWWEWNITLSYLVSTQYPVQCLAC